MRILAINGQATKGLMIPGIRALLGKPVQNMIALELQYDPSGYAAYDGGAELKAAQARKQGQAAAGAGGSARPSKLPPVSLRGASLLVVAEECERYAAP